MAKDRSKVSVIIPNYNRKEHLGRLLPSIARQTYSDYELIVIDDCSPDRSAVEYIRSFIKDYGNMHLVENEENMGFVRTCNRGFTMASGEYICLLTKDTEVTSDFVERNVAIMSDDSNIGVLSCIIVDQDGNNWFCGGSLKTWIPLILRDDFQGVRPVDFVAGTACFYRREVFDQIGLLNEYFVMYHEDVEFCLRVKNETDYKVCMFAEKLVRHYAGSSTLVPKQVPYYLHRNHILLLKRYSRKSIPRVLLYYLREITNLLFLSISKLSPGYFLDSRHIIRGALDGLIKRQSE